MIKLDPPTLAALEEHVCAPFLLYPDPVDPHVLARGEIVDAIRRSRGGLDEPPSRRASAWIAALEDGAVRAGAAGDRWWEDALEELAREVRVRASFVEIVLVVVLEPGAAEARVFEDASPYRAAVRAARAGGPGTEAVVVTASRPPLRGRGARVAWGAWTVLAYVAEDA